MRKKELKTVVTFHTTADAMAMEQTFRKNHIPGRIIPVPGVLSAGCGLCWCSDPGTSGLLKKMMRQEGIQEEEICEIVI